MTYQKISQDDYEKAKGQLRLQLGEVLSVFMMYGLQEYIPGAIIEIVELCEQFGKRVRGADVPIVLKNKINSRT